MAIKDKGYGTSGSVGFDDVIERDDDGKAESYLTADAFPAGDHYLEVVSLDVWENDKGDDFVKVWLFDGAAGKLTRLFGKLTTKTIWKLDRSIGGIFGRMLPDAEIQAPTGRMPITTRTAALGRFVKVSVKDSGFEEQDVLITDGPFKAPDGVKPMFGPDGAATGNWPTTAAALRGGKGSAATGRARSAAPAKGATSAADDDDDW